MKHYSIALVAAFFLIQPFISVAQNSSINVQSSSVEWAAGKIVGGDHNGTIEINKGSLVLEDDRIVSGSVALDMTTMANSDLSPEYGAKLMGHLKSPDFFDVASHPMATLVINEASKFKKNKATIKANATNTASVQRYGFPLAMVPPDLVLVCRRPNGTPSVVKP